VVKVGDTVEVKVVEIDSARNKIGLSMKNVDVESASSALSQPRVEENGTFRLGNVIDLSKFSD